MEDKHSQLIVEDGQQRGKKEEQTGKEQMHRI
jgi:hypothetical protein